MHEFDNNPIQHDPNRRTPSSAWSTAPAGRAGAPAPDQLRPGPDDQAWPNTAAAQSAGAFTGDSQPAADALEPLLAHFAALVADALAPRLAAELAERAGHAPAHTATRRLLSLDQLVQLLPAGKSPKTWKRWLYERTRHNQVPGCHRIGNRLFFDHEHTIPWLTGERLDVRGPASLHHTPMPNQPDKPRQPGRAVG